MIRQTFVKFTYRWTFSFFNAIQAPAPGQPAGSSTPKEQRVGSLALGTMSRLIQILRMIHEVSDNGGRDYRLVMQRMHAMSAQAAGFKKGGGGQRR